jgi:ribosomal protection tetracycline resistance protein
VDIVNIGILAHVDAGKTSLTERLLYDAGATDRLGSVDAGTTQTDTGDLERARGITIRSAVAAFTVGDRRVNLIDTPGHSDFVAEVERALGVLDGAVLVLSAVEGVQPHTRVLMRILRGLRLPTLIFVNKIDRVGARGAELIADVARRLTPHVVPLGAVRALGTPDADFVASPDDLALATALADHDDGLLELLVKDIVPAPDRLHAALRAQTAAGQVYPLFFGCALSGAGVGALLDGVHRLLPPAPAAEERLRGRVFAIERGSGGDKVAYLRSYGGQLRARQRVAVYRQEPDGRVTRSGGQVSALHVVGSPLAQVLTGGEIAQIRGLPEIRIGDQLGSPDGLGSTAHFARPGLEAVVLPRRTGDAAALHKALVSLADEDPLIRTRVTADGQSSVLLYGEVQREVVAATLADVYGIEVAFEPTQIVHVERPAGVGSAYEPIGHGFAASVGLRVTPGSGICYRREVELGSLPLAFHRAIEETVGHALEQGVYGWPVTDATVTLTQCGYWSPITVAADFRNLTPLVLAQALARAGTRVYEPCHRFDVEIAPDRIGPVTACLAQLGGRIEQTDSREGSWHVTGDLPARAVAAARGQLTTMSRGEGTWTSQPDGDRLVKGAPPTRRRTDGNPYDRAEYLRFVAQRA